MTLGGLFSNIHSQDVGDSNLTLQISLVKIHIALPVPGGLSLE